MKMDLILIFTVIIIATVVYVGLRFLKVASKKNTASVNDKDSELSSNDEKAYNYHIMGNAHYKSGNYDKAIECFKKAGELKPGYAGAYNNMGAAYYGKGNYDEAIKYYEKAVELKHDYEAAYFNMGIAYRALGNHEKANDCFQKGV